MRMRTQSGDTDALPTSAGTSFRDRSASGPSKTHSAAGSTDSSIPGDSIIRPTPPNRLPDRPVGSSNPKCNRLGVRTLIIACNLWRIRGRVPLDVLLQELERLPLLLAAGLLHGHGEPFELLQDIRSR